MYVSRRVFLKNVLRVISNPSPFTSISSAAICHNDGKQSAGPANLGATLVPRTATYADTNMRLLMPVNLRFMSQIAQQSQVEEAMAMSVDVLQGSPNEYKDPLAWSHLTTEIPAAHAANLMVNQILKCGKKSTARRILNGALKKIQEKTGKNPFAVLQEAIEAASPCVRVKRRRVGGTTYKVPNPIRSEQGKKVGIRWLVAAARKRPDRKMDAKLSEELIDAARGTGDAVRKKEESHRIAMTNRAFSHFR